MKKAHITFVVVIIVCILVVYPRVFAYGQSSTIHDFPIPKAAELTQINQHTKIYHWSKASEEKGIPSSYESFIERTGWKKGEQEGASIIFTKGTKTIELISMTNQLTIIY
ncbi:hypothetical protein [Oceanobacillus sp. 1P07AA]|uniref:hypothetical protein n=1 Tax=Oceanobacillus sp. 1P07AA TaxID=3132293 RepID=UPI0039A74F47